MKTDGMITNVPGICLVTFYADCVPLYFVDPVKKACNLERYMLSSQMRLWIYHGDE